MDINFCQSFRKKHSCETQLIIIINDWAKILAQGGQPTHSFWTLKKLPTHPLMNYLNVSYMAMGLVGKLKNG